MPVATDREQDEDAVDAVDDAPESAEDDSKVAPRLRTEKSATRLAMLFGLAMVAVLAMLLAWLGFHAYQTQQEQTRQALFLQTARQGALNLTTIDWQHADADVQRILEGATGQFHDDFSSRSGPFVELVKKAKSITVGTVTEAGLESHTADTAQALVAVTVKTSNAGTDDPQPRDWRLRVFVQKVGDQAKVSNVEFVP
jgi:Mce-associated membrane protein